MQSYEKRVLFVPPTVRDGEITCSLLASAGLTCILCKGLNRLVKEFHAGAGAILLTEEALTAEGIPCIHINPKFLSDVPIEPKFATNGGAIYADHIELYCAQKPAVCEGQWLMIRTLDPHGESRAPILFPHLELCINAGLHRSQISEEIYSSNATY